MRKLWWVLILFANSAHAADPSLKSKFTVEVGPFYTNLGKASNTPLGNKSFLPTSQLMFSVSSRMSSLRPELGFTIIPRHGANSSYDSRTLMLSVPFVMETSTVGWKVGIAYWLHMLTGGAGNVNLANGTSTATYSRPGRNETAKVLALDLGVTIPITGKLILDTDFYITTILSSRRSFNFLIQVGWAVL